MKTGTAKPLDAITLGDALKHPIWVWALDEAHQEGQDETWQKPVIGETDVGPELVSRFLTATITLRIEGTASYASGEYDHRTASLSSLAVWQGDEWRLFSEATEVSFPVVLEAVPTIHGTAGLRFVLQSPADDQADQVD